MSLPNTRTPASPSSRYDVVVMAASRGGLMALKQVLSKLPREFPLPLVVVLHRSPYRESRLDELLRGWTQLAVRTVVAGERLVAGTIYVAPPDLHVVVRPDRTLTLVDGHRVRHVFSSANPLFESAAAALGGRVIAVVLTGHDSDATDGVQSVKAMGGTVIAQDQATSEAFDMPRSAIRTGAVDSVLPLEDIAPTLVRLAMADGDGGRRRA